MTQRREPTGRLTAKPNPRRGEAAGRAEKTWAARVKEAVERFGIPCAQGEWDAGEERRYFVFDGNLIPAFYADDGPEYERVLIQLHFFTTAGEDTMALRKEIKGALRDAGFTYPAEISISDDRLYREAGVQHVVFEFEGLEAV